MRLGATSTIKLTSRRHCIGLFVFDGCRFYGQGHLLRDVTPYLVDCQTGISPNRQAAWLCQQLALPDTARLKALLRINLHPLSSVCLDLFVATIPDTVQVLPGWHQAFSLDELATAQTENLFLSTLGRFYLNDELSRHT